MRTVFSGTVWCSPSAEPAYFLTVAPGCSRDLADAALMIPAWNGVIPGVAQIGETQWVTSLGEKDGRFVLAIDEAVRAAERIEEGDDVTAEFEVEWPSENLVASQL